MRLSTKEAGVLAACLQYLSVAGIFSWRQNTAGIRRRDRTGRAWWSFQGMKGVSDILGVLPGGRLLAVECKAPGGKLSEAQIYFLGKVNAAGGLGVVVHGVDDLIEALKLERAVEGGSPCQRC